MEIFNINNLSFSYPTSEKKALKNLNFKINNGEFILLCGQSGCGKSTLLRHFKKEITPNGRQEGEIRYNGMNLKDLDLRTSASEIGFVMQNPEHQVVTDTVWHELAFGLESIGVKSDEIRRRVAEISSFLGISHWFRKEIKDLSGGQKQMLSLASVMVMQPKVLILDEPTSQLDPISATEFIETLRKLNSDLGMTILLSEHRLQEAFCVADRVVVMQEGEILFDEQPEKISEQNHIKSYPIYKGLPSAMRIFMELSGRGKCPITVKDGRNFLDQRCIVEGELEKKEYSMPKGKPALELSNVWFKYKKELPDVLRGLNFTAYESELFCILGGNGTGKSTALNLMCRNLSPYRGISRIFGKKLKEYKSAELYNGVIALLPQAPQTLFMHNSVLIELKEMEHKNTSLGYSLEEIIQIMELKPLLHSHPYDLSGGEQQRVAFAKILLKNPKILLLDEPTKGLDAEFKSKLAQILKKLTENKIAIIMATHDIEFAAEYADKCGMFFDGTMVSVADPVTFFSGNSYYTTAANRIARHVEQKAITCEDVVKLCKIKEQN